MTELPLCPKEKTSRADVVPVKELNHSWVGLTWLYISDTTELLSTDSAPGRGKTQTVLARKERKVCLHLELEKNPDCHRCTWKRKKPRLSSQRNCLSSLHLEEEEPRSYMKKTKCVCHCDTFKTKTHIILTRHVNNNESFLQSAFSNQN